MAQVRSQVEQLRGAEVFMAQSLSARFALLQKAITDALAAALAAKLQAEAAQATADYLNNVTIPAVNAAIASAQQAAANANAAASAAQAAANNANNAIGWLSKLQTWQADPSTVSPEQPLTYQVMPEMSISANFEGYPCLILFSCQIDSSIANQLTNIRATINGEVILGTHRVRTMDDAGSVSITFAWVVNLGNVTVDVRWGGTGSVLSPQKRRQLSILRIGTPPS